MDLRGVLGRALAPVLLPAKLARFFQRAPSPGSGLASLRSAIASRAASEADERAPDAKTE